MGRTTLVVAHKLSTIRNADVIAVVNGGTIVDIWNHNELINTNGHYARLSKLQRQLSALDQDQCLEGAHAPSTGRTSTARSSSAASFASPLPNNNRPQPLLSYPSPSLFRLLSLNSPEWKQGLIGSLSAVIFGTVQPLYALTIGGMISAFYVSSHAEMQARVERYALIFSSLCLASIALNLCQHYNFAYMGECLTRRIRLKMLEKILSFEAAWFDEEENSSAALCSRLSNEASMVKSLVADRLSLLIQSTSAVTTAMIMGIIIAWKLALVMIAVQPLTILCFDVRKVILSTITRKFRHLPVVENGEVTALLDITKCLYDAITRMEKAVVQGNAIAAAVEGVERHFGNNFFAMFWIHMLDSCGTPKMMRKKRKRLKANLD